MNIFVLSRDVDKAARALADVHVVKMTLETTQLLCTAIRYLVPDMPEDNLYRETHSNHPCTIWARSSPANYMWLLRYGFALCEEYTLRYGRVHKCQSVLSLLPVFKCDEEPSSFALAMPDEFKHSNPVTAYRRYYRLSKAVNIKRFTYTNRKPPAWLTCATSAPQKPGESLEQTSKV